MPIRCKARNERSMTELKSSLCLSFRAMLVNGWVTPSFCGPLTVFSGALAGCCGTHVSAEQVFPRIVVDWAIRCVSGAAISMPYWSVFPETGLHALTALKLLRILAVIRF